MLIHRARSWRIGRQSNAVELVRGMRAGARDDALSLLPKIPTSRSHRRPVARVLGPGPRNYRRLCRIEYSTATRRALASSHRMAAGAEDFRVPYSPTPFREREHPV